MKYYSEILNKNFDTEQELVKAEEEHKAEQAKKEEAKALVKKESSEVEDAFKARNAARHAYNEAAKGKDFKYYVFSHPDIRFLDENALSDIIGYIDSLGSFGVELGGLVVLAYVLEGNGAQEAHLVA